MKSVVPSNLISAGLKSPIRDEPLIPPSTLILGDINAGKTYSIISALKAGLEVFVLVTENTGVDSLIKAVKEWKLDINKLHWKRCTPARQSWDVMKAQAKLSNANSVGDLQTMTAGLERHKYPAFLNLIDACANFRCDRTKQEYGDVLAFGEDKLLALDSVSGLGEIVSTHVCGHRITMTQPEFGVVQNHIFNLISQLTSGNSHFLATAHVELEVDEVKATTKLMTSTVGKKLAPKIPRPFSDVIYCKMDPKTGIPSWTNIEPNVITKTRYLKRGVHAADYKLIMDGYAELKAEAEKEMEIQG